MSSSTASMSPRGKSPWLAVLALAVAPLLLLVLWRYGASAPKPALVSVPAALETEPEGATTTLQSPGRTGHRSEVAVKANVRSPRPKVVGATSAAPGSVPALDPRWCTIVGQLELTDGFDKQQTFAELIDTRGKQDRAVLRWTDEDGSFMVAVEKPGHYQLRLSAFAVGNTPMVEVDLVLGEAVDVGLMRLERGFRMKGRAALVTGEPLGGYYLRFDAEDDGYASGSTTGNRHQIIRTDADGGFEFSGMVAGDYKCSIRSGSLVVVEGESISAGSLSHMIVVEGSVLVVRLVAEDGSPQNIRRLVATPVIEVVGQRLPSVHVPLDGSKPFGSTTRHVDLRPGAAYRIVAESFGGRAYGGDWPAGKPAGRYHLDLVPDTLGAGEIVIQANSQQPLINARLVVASLMQGSTRVRPLRVAHHVEDQTLLHSLKGLPAGTYDLACYLESDGALSLKGGSQRVEVEPGRTTTLEMDVVEGGRLRVTLLPPLGSKPSEPAVVHLRRRTTSGQGNAWVPIVYSMVKSGGKKARGGRPRVRRDQLPVNGEAAITSAHPPGDYELRVTHSALKELRVNCTVVAGVTTAHECQMEE